MAELEFVGTTGRSKTNNNPFNLVRLPGSYQDQYGAELEPVSKSGQQKFAKFPTMQAGYEAGLHQIRIDQSRNHTLKTFVYKFAPPNENPSEQLVKQYSKELGISPDTPISDIPVERLAIPILKRESSTTVKPKELSERKSLLNQLAATFGPSQAEAAEIPTDTVPTYTAPTPSTAIPNVQELLQTDNRDVLETEILNKVIMGDFNGLRESLPQVIAGMEPDDFNNRFNPVYGRMLKNIMNQTKLPIGEAYKIQKPYEKEVWDFLNTTGLMGGNADESGMKVLSERETLQKQVQQTFGIEDATPVVSAEQQPKDVDRENVINELHNTFGLTAPKSAETPVPTSVGQPTAAGAFPTPPAAFAADVERFPKQEVISTARPELPKVKEEDELPLLADLGLWAATIPLDVAVGGTSLLATKNPAISAIASGAAAGVQYQIMREFIHSLGGPEAKKSLLLGWLEDKSPDVLKPYVRTADQASQMALLGRGLHGAKNLLFGKPAEELLGKEATTGVLQKIDKAVIKPLADFSEKYWKPVSDWTVNNIIIKPTEMGQPLPGTDPTVGGYQTLQKLFQPAIERLRNTPGQEEAVKSLEEGRAYRNIMRAFQGKVNDVLNELLPSERVEYIRATAGEKGFTPSSNKVKDLVQETTDFITGNFDKRYSDAFEKQYRSLLFKPFKQTQKTYPLDVLDLFLTESEKGLTKQTPKAIRSMLDKIVYDPLLPIELKQQASALYNLPHNQPTLIGRASNIAMRDFITQNLLKDPKATAVTAGGDYVDSTWRGLKGLNLHKDIETELHSMDKLFKPAEGWYNEWFLPMWKTNKVILRPAAWGRNLISNLMLNDWGGLPWWRGDVYVEALKKMRSGDSSYKKYVKKCAFADMFTSEDMGNMAEFPRQGESGFEMMWRMYNHVANPARRMYGMTEQWAKYSKYLHNIERGMPADEAAKDSIKYTFNYGETTSFIQTIRQSKFGMPFATWWSKSIPLWIETSVNHPLRVAKWYGLYHLWQGHALDQVGMTDEEWKTMQGQFTGYMKGNMYALMPWRDDKNQLKLLNLTWMLPGQGDVSEILNRSSNNIWTLLFQSPINSAAGTLVTKTLQGGSPLYYDWETGSAQAMKTFSYLWNLWVPSMVPGGVDFQMIWDTMNERPEALTSQEALAASMGIKLSSIDPTNVRRKHIAMQQIHESEAGMQLRTQLRKYPDKREQILEDYRKNVRRIWNKPTGDEPKSMLEEVQDIDMERRSK